MESLVDLIATSFIPLFFIKGVWLQIQSTPSAILVVVVQLDLLVWCQDKNKQGSSTLHVRVRACRRGQNKSLSKL
jgi:hypothetical protein